MCEECAWADALDSIEELLNDEKQRFKFAEDFLTSVQEWVTKNEHISTKQMQGIQNVRRAGERKKR